MASLQKKTIKGIDYWCLVESKRINGRPRSIIIEYFGNSKKFAERLINDRPENLILKSYSHGDTFALWKMADKLGIESILESAFKSKTRDNIRRSRSLLLIAIQRVCNPGSKNEFEDWFKTTTLPYDININPKVLTSQHFWGQMDGITEAELIAAEDAIMKRVLELYDFDLEKIALDYTNYFSYISTTNDRAAIAKRGHNKQKRNDLKQYSLALITTKEMGLPLCSHIYEGNANDQTEFCRYIDMLKTRIPNYDPGMITLVFDGGSNNKANFEKIETHYICSFSLSSCKNLYDIDLSSYCDVAVNGKKVKSYRCEQVIWDKKRECILTFSSGLYEGQLSELQQNITTTISELKKLNQQLANVKSRISKKEKDIMERIKKILSRQYMDEVFEIRMEVDETVKSIVYLVNETKKDELVRKYFGKKLILTDRVDWCTAEILKTYRDQDCIEKIFRTTKDTDHFSIRPQYHFTDQKIRVHIFCCLVGLTIASILQKEVANHGLEISKNQLLDRLSEIRRCWVKKRDSNKAVSVLEEMDSLHRELWDTIQSI